MSKGYSPKLNIFSNVLATAVVFALAPSFLSLLSRNSDIDAGFVIVCHLIMVGLCTITAAVAYQNHQRFKRYAKMQENSHYEH